MATPTSTATESGKPEVRYPKFNYRDHGKFEPRDTISVTSQAAYISLGAGTFVAAVKASLGPPRAGFASILQNSKYIWLYGAAGTAYTFVESVSANLTERESAWNKFNGGAAAGAVIGATYRSVPKVVGGALAVGTILGLADFAGDFKGYGRKQAQENARGDTIELANGDRQGFWDVVHRRPLSQTMEELGDLVKPFK